MGEITKAVRQVMAQACQEKILTVRNNCALVGFFYLIYNT